MKAIAAMDPYRVIGYKGKIPWHFREDMQWFKSFTMGKTLVMGRTTFQSIPPLRGRNICVITNDQFLAFDRDAHMKCDKLYIRRPFNNGTMVDQFDPETWSDAIVCGGAKTYHLLMPYVTELYMSHIADDYEGDTYMPEFESLLPESEIVREHKDFIIVRHFKSLPPPVTRRQDRKGHTQFVW